MQEIFRQNSRFFFIFFLYVPIPIKKFYGDNRVVRTLLVLIIAFGQMCIMPFVQAQQIVFAPLYGAQIWDFDDPGFMGFGPDGSGFGAIVGLKDGPSTLEGFAKYGKWTNEFTYEDINFRVASTDLVLGVGIRREIWFPQVHGRLGLAMHQLSTTLNDSFEADSDFAMSFLQDLNGRRVAGFFGVGVNLDLSPNRSSLAIDFVIHKFPGNTLYDIEAGLYFYF